VENGVTSDSIETKKILTSASRLTGKVCAVIEVSGLTSPSSSLSLPPAYAGVRKTSIIIRINHEHKL